MSAFAASSLTSCTNVYMRVRDGYWLTARGFTLTEGARPQRARAFSRWRVRVTVFNAVMRALLFAGFLMIVRQQYRHGFRLSEFLFEPSGIRLRVWLLVATSTVMQVTTGSVAWPFVTGVWFGIAAWETSVQATAWIRCVRHRRAAE